MARPATVSILLVLAAIMHAILARPVHADIAAQAKCQQRIAAQGARYAQRVIRATLKCTNAIAKCQIECEEGYSARRATRIPSPGCCDPDDPASNATFGDCMSDAQRTCDTETEKIGKYEIAKQGSITAACSALTQEELCGSQAEGLNFATLNAGCAALNPGYVCNLPNMVVCVGGPLERTLLDQISATLDPRAGDAIAALNLHAAFPDVPITRKVRGTVAAGSTDMWAISGKAGDQVIARVKTGDDNGNDTSNLQPGLSLVASDGTTPIINTTVRTVDCGVTSVCGATCPLLKRTLPYDGTFNLAVSGVGGGGCAGGKYKLIVTSPAGGVPLLVSDEVTAH